MDGGFILGLGGDGLRVTGGVFGVTGSGFRSYRFGVSRFGVWGSALGVEGFNGSRFSQCGGSRFGVFAVCWFEVSRFEVSGLALRVPGSGLRGKGFGMRGRGCGFGFFAVRCFGFGVSLFGVSGSGFRFWGFRGMTC